MSMTPRSKSREVVDELAAELGIGSARQPRRDEGWRGVSSVIARESIMAISADDMRATSGRLHRCSKRPDPPASVSVASLHDEAVDLAILRLGMT